MIANRDDYLEKLMVFRGRNHIGASYKYYYADPGLRNARLDFLHRDDGHIMENIIYNELIYRGDSVQIVVVEAYGKDALNKTTQSCLETDFVASRGGGYYCMRSAWSLDSLLKEEHKRRSLLKINDSFKKMIILHSSALSEETMTGSPISALKSFF